MIETRLSERIAIPAEDRGTSVKDREGEVLAGLVREGQCSRTLEIGLAWGLSAAYIMGAHKGQHVAIDPFQQEHFKDQGLQNLRALGFEERLCFHGDFSHSVLPKLLDEERKFDFAFIDGGHRMDQIQVDFYFADLLLQEQGVIVFHDMWMRGSQLVLSFIKSNRKDYELVRTPAQNLGVVRKIGSDERSWSHFREFYNVRGMLGHWLSNRRTARG